MTAEATAKLASVINVQVGHQPFAVSPWMKEPNTLAVYHEDGETWDLIQSDDARTLYYATRHTVRHRNNAEIWEGNE